MMNSASFLGLVQNAALLLSVALIFDLFASRWRKGQWSFQQAPVGIAIGAIGITIMLTPWTFTPGIVFDTRSVLIGISGLFFGSFSAAIAMTMTAVFRFYQGGTGAWTGIAVIIISGLIGIAWRQLRQLPLSNISWTELYLFGMVIHLAMLATMFTLPWETALRVLSNIALPVILIYPLGTSLLGLLMVKQLQRERMAEDLHISEERFRLLSEAAFEAIAIHEEGVLLNANDQYFKMFGYDPGEALGKQMMSMTIAPEAREFVIKQIATDSLGPYESIGVRKDGTRFPIEIRARRMDYKGQNVRFGTIFDITDRKRAEEAMRESELKYRSLIECSSDAIFCVDEKGEYKFTNHLFSSTFGKTPDYFIGKTFWDIYPKEHADYRYETTKRVLQTGKSESIEVEVPLPDKTLYFYATADPIKDETGKVILVLTHATDITSNRQSAEEKRLLEERLGRAEKMEALGQLAGGVAHDLNNVLGIVVGYAELALGGLDKSSPLRNHLENVMTGGLKAAAIVDDLLTLARRGVTGSEILNLNKIIADFQKSPELEKLYTYHPSVKIKTDMDNDLLNISGSSVHIGKSLYNLVSNAAEAMPQGGILTIKTSNQYLDKPVSGYENIREGDYVVVSMSDTGEGISGTNLKHIFEPFYTKKKMGRSGTGLGLAVVWGTVKDHHGYINVESEVGKGTTFTLYFPVTREDIPAKAETAAISEYTGKGESILIVDDVKEQRDLAAGMLQTLNYNVSIVAGGDEAVAYLKEHQVDLIVLDMIMDPGMDGLDTYKRILKIKPRQKAIIVSGYSESDRVKEARGLGAGSYIRKPYVKEKLGLAVRKELESKANRLKTEGKEDT